MAKGKIIRVAGPLVVAELEAKMNEMVRVGEEGLIGEVIRIEGKKAYIQVYEDTTGLRPGDPVEGTGEPLCAELGPGLLTNIFDGLQRPLKTISELCGIFIKRGVKEPALDRKKEWEFVPLVKPGEEVHEGQRIGYVQETEAIKHYILVPPGVNGKVEEIYEGKFTVLDTVAKIDGKEIKMMQKWPVRIPRPYRQKIPYNYPFITGVRVLDVMFPIAKGGSAAVPGPFGSGKTVITQQLAKWSDADVVVLIGCGERGNEMTDVLEEFPELVDPKTGRKLIERTVIIANTSNMPVAARESSVYMGITIAEYFRDMGYSVLLVADSTSRWAEAMREVSGRLGEMPGEEGFPAYLAKRLAEFYERAGRVRAAGSPDRDGSVTIAASVSPPGGDFTEPVTSHTIRFVSAFWPLSARIAAMRHYPAFDWLMGFSKYVDTVQDWWHKNLGPDWRQLRDTMVEILTREAELMEIVRILGTEALSEYEKHILNTAYLIREGFLKQDAFHPIDCRSSPKKTYWLMKIVIDVYWKKGVEAVRKGVPAAALRELETARRYPRLRMEVALGEEDKLIEFYKKMSEEIDNLIAQYTRK